MRAFTSSLAAAWLLRLAHLVWAQGAGPPAETAWPTDQVLADLAGGKGVATFRLALADGGDPNCWLEARGDLSGRYSIVNSTTNLFPRRLPEQIGTYAFKTTEAQRRRVADILRIGRFAHLKSPPGIIIGTYCKSVRLEFGGKTRFVMFPTAQAPPRGFQRMWRDLVALFAECELIPEKCVGVKLSIPARAARGRPIPVELEIANIGPAKLALPNPECAANEHVLLVTLLAHKGGGATSKGRPDVLVHEVALTRRTGAGPVLWLRSGGRVKLPIPPCLILPAVGEYAIAAVLVVGAPDIEGPAKALRGKTITGRVMTKYAKVSVE